MLLLFTISLQHLELVHLALVDKKKTNLPSVYKQDIRLLLRYPHQASHKGQDLSMGAVKKLYACARMETYQARANINNILWHEENKSVHFSRDRDSQFRYRQNTR